MARAERWICARSARDPVSRIGRGREQLRVREALMGMRGDRDPWLQTEEWNRVSLSDELLETCIRLSFVPTESFARCIEMPEQYGQFSARVRGWERDRDAKIFAFMIQSDVDLLLSWVRGVDLRELAASDPRELPKRGPLRHKGAAARFLDLNDYYTQKSSYLAWMYSGVVRVADYLAKHEAVPIPDDIRVGINLLRHGVSGRAAAFLVSKLGIPRVAASQLVSHLDIDVYFPEETTLESFMQSSPTTLRDIITDDALAAHVLEVWASLQSRDED